MALKRKTSHRRHVRGAPRAPVRLPPPSPSPSTIAGRADVRRAIVAALSLATLLGGVRVWENSAHAASLRSYLRRLYRAEQPAIRDLSPESATELSPAVRSFAAANTSVGNFLKLANAWERDFRASVQSVSALRAPAPLRDAQRLIVKGLDLYVGVARLYNLAAQQRGVADAQGAKAQAAFEQKVQVTLLQAQEMQQRAADVYSLGGATLERYRHEWLGLPPGPSLTGVPAGLLTAAPTPAPSAPAGAQG